MKDGKSDGRETITYSYIIVIIIISVIIMAAQQCSIYNMVWVITVLLSDSHEKDIVHFFIPLQQARTVTGILLLTTSVSLNVTECYCCLKVNTERQYGLNLEYILEHQPFNISFTVRRKVLQHEPWSYNRECQWKTSTSFVWGIMV